MSAKQRCVHRSKTCCQPFKHFDNVFATCGNNIVEVFVFVFVYYTHNYICLKSHWCIVEPWKFFKKNTKKLTRGNINVLKPTIILILNVKQVEAYFITIPSVNNKRICTLSALCTSITLWNVKRKIHKIVKHKFDKKKYIIFWNLVIWRFDESSEIKRTFFIYYAHLLFFLYFNNNNNNNNNTRICIASYLKKITLRRFT